VDEFRKCQFTQDTFRWHKARIIRELVQRTIDLARLVDPTISEDFKVTAFRITSEGGQTLGYRVLVVGSFTDTGVLQVQTMLGAFNMMYDKLRKDSRNPIPAWRMRWMEQDLQSVSGLNSLPEQEPA